MALTIDQAKQALQGKIFRVMVQHPKILCPLNRKLKVKLGEFGRIVNVHRSDSNEVTGIIDSHRGQNWDYRDHVRYEFQGGDNDQFWLEVQLRADNSVYFIPQNSVCIDWPCGYPCRARNTYHGPSNMNEVPPKFQIFNIRSGTVGRVRQVLVRAKKENDVWVYVSAIRGEVRNGQNNDGWVPLRYLDIGPRAIGDYEYIGRGPSSRVNASGILATDDTRSLTRLHRTISALLSILRFRAEEFEIDFLRNEFAQELPDQKRIEEYSALIVDGVREAGMLEVLEKSDFTLKELRDKGVRIHTQAAQRDLRKGIYLFWYDFESRFREDELYTGSTLMGFSERLVGHIYDMKHGKKNAPHPKAMRESKTQKMFPICILKNASVFTTKLAEGTFCLFLDTYSDRLLNLDVKLVDQDLADGMPDEDETLVDKKATQVEKAAIWGRNKEVALRLRSVAQEAMRLTGFPGGCRRKAFFNARAFGASTGTNWSSPFLEFAQDTIYFTRFDLPGEAVIFRRKQTRCTTTKLYPNYLVLCEIKRRYSGDHKQSIRFAIPANASGPKPHAGAAIYLVFEIRLTGSHDHAWANIPKFGPWTDWQDANRLGVRAQWQDENGSWYERWLGTESYLTLQAGYEGSLSQYAQSMALMRYLLQRQRKGLRSWERDFGFASVKQITYNYFDQTIAIKDRIPDANNIDPKPRRLTEEEEEQALIEAGVSRYGGAFGELKSRRGPSRRSCDFCVLAGTLQGYHHIKCIKIGDTGRCERCKSYGLHKCTWTPTEILRTNQTIQRTLNFGPKDENSLVTEIDEPKILGPTGQEKVDTT